MLKTRDLALVVLFVLGAGLRTVEIPRPVNQRSWREADIAGIARNYSREGMSLLHPRVDWRGDKPGYAEMEFPALSYSMAVLYRGFGVHEAFGRAIAFVFSLIALGAFFLLARWLVPGWGAVAAALFFAVHPLTFEISTSLQPDGIMFACYMVAVLAFLRWQESGSRRAYVLALVGTAGAILAKASSAHLGLLLAALVLRKDGLRALRKPAILAFGPLALLPAALWYHHAHRFWLDYGLSLGLSNERHFLGTRLLTEPAFLRGIISIERVSVFTNAGFVLAVLALLLDRRARAVTLAIAWLAAAAVFYLLAAGSTSQHWAYYYHVFSAPAAALLAGSAVAVAIARWRENRTPMHTGVLGFAVFALAASVGFEAKADLDGYRLRREPNPEYVCAPRLAPSIPDGALILASGGPCSDDHGRRFAYNASYMFYWLDHKGWNVCEQEQSMAAVQSFAQRGARVFVAEKPALDKMPGFQAALDATYPRPVECDGLRMYSLH